MSIRPAQKNLITTSQLLDGVRRMEPNSGLLETHGEAIGDKEETSDLSEELTTSELKALALGLLQSTLGLKILETKLNLPLKIWNQNFLFRLMTTINAKDYLQKE